MKTQPVRKFVCGVSSLLLVSIVACDNKEAPSAPPPPTASAKEESSFPKLECDSRPEYAKFEKKKGDHTINCVLKSAATVDGIECKKGARAILYESGKLNECQIEKPKKIGDVTCKGQVNFSESGKLKGCYTDGPQEIGGVTCGMSVELHAETGKLRRCKTSSGSATVGGITIPGESYVTLDEAGKVTRVEYATGKSIKFKTFTCTETSHHASGAIKVCVTPDKITYKGKELPMATRLCFDEKGEQSTKGDPRCMKW